MSYHSGIGTAQCHGHLQPKAVGAWSRPVAGAVVYGVFGLLMAGGIYGGYRLGAHFKHPWLGAAGGAAVTYVPAWIAAAITALVTMDST